MSLSRDNGRCRFVGAYFRLGDWQVEPALGRIEAAGQVHELEPRVMEVLVYLAQHPGEVVSREDLERAVWRGALVGYDAVTNTVIKLRKALDDRARQPRYIETIPKKGYRLIASVQTSSQSAAASVSDSPAQHETPTAALARDTDQATGTTSPGTETLLVSGWAFDPRANCMSDGQTEIRLEPKVSQVLSLLAANAGQAVTREALAKHVWPGVIVGEDAISNTVIKLRKVFDDDPHAPRVIETIPKVGYRLVAECSAWWRERRPVQPGHLIVGASAGSSIWSSWRCCSWPERCFLLPMTLIMGRALRV